MEGNFVRVISVLVGLASAIGLLAIGTGHIQPDGPPLTIDDHIGLLCLGAGTLTMVLMFIWPPKRKKIW
jgi:hypothetical protein